MEKPEITMASFSLLFSFLHVSGIQRITWAVLVRRDSSSYPDFCDMRSVHKGVLTNPGNGKLNVSIPL